LISAWLRRDGCAWFAFRGSVWHIGCFALLIGMKTARSWIGISGYDYPGWKGRFYPAGLPRSRWLRYAAEAFDSIEINGTFYSLKAPSTFRRWTSQVPGPPFVFAVKGGRFITHNLKLRNAEPALANFFASGVLALGDRTGPFLWQLPGTYAFSPERLEGFLRLLPRSSVEAAALARGHNDRLPGEALTEAETELPLRHAFEVRHESWFHPEMYALLREHGAGFVVADTAGRWRLADEVTAGFVYVRLHGSRELYVSDYTDGELDEWARRVHSWLSGPPARDVYVYFDNDAKVHAPNDARRLRARVDALLLGGDRQRERAPSPGARGRQATG
jgi:uncharacterized protein YecE (DUF72 family)